VVKVNFTNVPQADLKSSRFFRRDGSSSLVWGRKGSRGGEWVNFRDVRTLLRFPKGGATGAHRAGGRNVH